MKIIYILIPLSLVLLALAVWAFFWAVKNDQFDDLDTPAMDILDDDDDTKTDAEAEQVEGEGGSRDVRES
jgi:cbb3-type cytochrome oxidase maturation protein